MPDATAVIGTGGHSRWSGGHAETRPVLRSKPREKIEKGCVCVKDVIQAAWHLSLRSPNLSSQVRR